MAVQQFNTVMKNRTVDLITSRSTSAVSMSIATVTIYSGSMPANPDTAPAGSALATVSMSAGRWGAASSGATQLGSPLAFTPTSSGTAGFIRFSSSGMIMDLDITNPSGGGACILPSTSLTAGTPTYIQAMAWKIAATGSGSIKISTALRDRLIDMWTGIAATGPDMGTGGAFNIYTGSAPATADDPATGTLIWTGTLSGTTYNVAAGAAASLSASVTANAVATNTAGYLRWTDGTYVIQGSVGTAATDFIVSATSMTSGNSYSITEATVAV